VTAIHRCKRCGLPVKWVTTTQQKSQALDPLPNAEGSVAIVAGLGVTLTKAQRDEHNGDLWMPHAATCAKRRPASKPAPVGLTAITGLSFVDETDRVAQSLVRFAREMVKRAPDENDCRVAWRYYTAKNTVDPKVRPYIGARVREIVAKRNQPQEARA
jgi:hypothetical protein